MNSCHFGTIRHLLILIFCVYCFCVIVVYVCFRYALDHGDNHTFSGITIVLVYTPTHYAVCLTKNRIHDVCPNPMVYSVWAVRAFNSFLVRTMFGVSNNKSLTLQGPVSLEFCMQYYFMYCLFFCRLSFLQWVVYSLSSKDIPNGHWNS